MKSNIKWANNFFKETIDFLTDKKREFVSLHTPRKIYIGQT